MNEGAYREAPPPTRDEFEVLVGRVANLETKPRKVAAEPKRWTRRRHFTLRLGIVAPVVVAYGLVWDAVSKHETGMFVSGSVLVGLLLLAVGISAIAVAPAEYGPSQWDDIAYPNGF